MTVCGSGNGCRINTQYQMKTGKVKFFNDAKGFGFIVVDENNSEIFVHHSGLVDKIRENDLVEFEIIDGKKGQNAINVRRIQ